MNPRNPDTAPRPPSGGASIAMKRASIAVIIISGIATLLVPITGYPLIVFGGVGYEPFPIRQFLLLVLLGGPLLGVILLGAGWSTEPNSNDALPHGERTTPREGLSAFWKALIILMIFPGMPVITVLLALI